MGITLIQEDYTELIRSREYDIICTTTNMIVKNDGCLVMGGGVAKLFLDEFPGIDKMFGTIIKRSGNRQMIQVVPYERDSSIYYLVGFPTKIDWKNPSPLWLIERSMKQLIAFRAMAGSRKVLLPCPGTGLGGLTKEQVIPLIESIDGVDENIHICYQ